jgi:hypothetical protein
MTAMPNLKYADEARSRIDRAIQEREDAQADSLPLGDALKRAERLLTPECTAPEAAYPLAALGPLGEAAQSLADGAQVAPAMAGQSLLAAAALLCQSVANVRSLDGSSKPMSLFALTVALSGDGKDAADRIALRPVHDHQREAGRAFALVQAEHDRAEATRKRGDPPAEGPPPAPYRIAADVTVEGLRRSFAEGLASQGVFSTEAGVILAGHAMSAEHRTKSAATLCRAWDGGHLSVVRGGAGRLDRYGVRLSVHLLVQPAALGDTLADEGLSAIGFWPRFLLAWPAPLPPRVYRPWRAESSPAVGAYWSRCADLLRRAVPSDCDTLPTIELDDHALRGLATFFERMEREARRGTLRDVRPFALRATELACRVAGVQAAFAGRETIDAAAARNGCDLVAHSLDAWRDALQGRADPVPGWALTLYRWLAERAEPVPLRDIPRIGPAPVRPAARRDAALDRLRAAGLVDIAEGGAVALGVDRASG